MTRALGETVIQDTHGDIITGCTIDLLEPATGARLTVPVYADAISSNTLTLPYTSTDGRVSFYLALGQLVTVQATKGTLTGTETIAVTDPAAQGAGGALSGAATGDLTGTYPALTLRAGAATGSALGADVLVTGAGAQTKTGTLQAPIQLPNGLHLWDGTGAPINATGTDGDLYLRSDGAAAATLYQRVSGAWVLLTLPAGGTASGAITGTYPGPIGLAAGVATGAVLGTDVVNTGGGAQVKTGTLRTPLILPSGVRLWDGTGVPPNITGSNGDLFFRLDGAGTQAVPSVYQRVAGFWVALGQGGPPTGLAGGSLANSFPNPSLAAGAATGAALGADVLVIGAGAQIKTGILTAPITLPNGVHLWDGTGAPGAGLGANNDLYFRADGAGTSTLYQKVTGAWVLVGQSGAPSGPVTGGGDISGTYPGPLSIVAGAATGAALGTDVLVTGSGAQTKTGVLTAPIKLAAGLRLFDGTGAPGTLSGQANGDLYLRSDGAGTSTLYQLVAGVWTLVGQSGSPTGSAFGDLLGSTYPGPVIAALAVNTGKIAAGAVTSAKVDATVEIVSRKGTVNGYAGLGAGGLVPIAQLGTGTPTGLKFLRDDGTFQVPAGGSGEPYVVYAGTANSPSSAAANLTAFTTALAALPTTGGTILVTSGKYWFTTTPNVNKSNVRLVGEPGACFATTTGSNEPVLVLGIQNSSTVIQNVTVDGLEIDGNAYAFDIANTPGAVGATDSRTGGGTYTRTATSGTTSTVTVSGASWAAQPWASINGGPAFLYAFAGPNSPGYFPIASVAATTITITVAQGLAFSSSTHFAVVTQATFGDGSHSWASQNVGPQGVYARNIYGLRFRNNNVHDTAHSGIEADRDGDIWIDGGNKFDRCGIRALWDTHGGFPNNSITAWQFPSDTTFPARMVTVANNHIRHNAGVAIDLHGDGSTEVNAENNTITEGIIGNFGAGNVPWGIVVEMESVDAVDGSDVNIVGNTVMDHDHGVMAIAPATNGFGSVSITVRRVNITGNRISNCREAITLDGRTISVVGNQIDATGALAAGNNAVTFQTAVGYVPTTGTATGGSTTTLVVAGTPWTVNQYKGYGLLFTGGTGSGQSALILSNTNNTLTFVAVASAPTGTTTYSINQIHGDYVINSNTITTSGGGNAIKAQTGNSNYVEGVTIVGNHLRSVDNTGTGLIVTQGAGTLLKSVNAQMNTIIGFAVATSFSGGSNIVSNGTLTDNTAGVVSFNSKYRYGPGFSTPQAGDAGPEAYADAATTSVQFVAKRTGGTGAVVDLQRNGVSILSAPLSLTLTTWQSATLVGSPNLASGDTLQVVVTSITGPVTLISTEYVGTQ